MGKHQQSNVHTMQLLLLNPSRATACHPSMHTPCVSRAEVEHATGSKRVQYAHNGHMA
jgi:hypothetical protein